MEMIDETAGALPVTKVIFYEIGLGVADRPSYMRYWQQDAQSHEEALALIEKSAEAGDLPGRMHRPMPLAMRDNGHDHHESGFEDQDLSIVIERGNNIYAIRLVGPEEPSYNGRAKFGDNPVELIGMPDKFAPKNLIVVLPSLPDFGKKGAPSNGPTIGSWLVFTCNREGLIKEIFDAFPLGKKIDDHHFQIPFRFNLIDLESKLPVWMHDGHDSSQGGGLSKYRPSDHGGIHPDMEDQYPKEHGGFHPDYVSSYLYV